MAGGSAVADSVAHHTEVQIGPCIYRFFVFKFANEKRITNSFFVFKFANEKRIRFSFSKVK